MTLKGIPLSGQGTRCPPIFHLQETGSWRIRLFLFRTDDSAGPGTGAEMTTTLNYGKPNWCLGINSAQLATAFDISQENIFSHNRARTLFLVRTDDVPATLGGTRQALHLPNR